PRGASRPAAGGRAISRRNGCAGAYKPTRATAANPITQGDPMPRPAILYSGGWADVPLEELAARAGDWGYQGLELCCWGDHFEVQRSLSEDDYCQHKLDLLARHDLQISVLGAYRVGQAVCDRIEPRRSRILPDYVWGDGHTSGAT